MRDTHTLTRHKDIQNWVSDRKGLPAIAQIRDRFGEVKAKLALRFDKPKSPEPALDEGVTPCSWTAWLAELDRQQLALKVTNQSQPSFEFVARRELN